MFTLFLTIAFILIALALTLEILDQRAENNRLRRIDDTVRA